MGLFSLLRLAAAGPRAPAGRLARSQVVRGTRGRSVASMLSQDLDEDTKDWEVLYPEGDCESFLKSTCDNGYVSPPLFA